MIKYQIGNIISYWNNNIVKLRQNPEKNNQISIKKFPILLKIQSFKFQKISSFILDIFSRH